MLIDKKIGRQVVAYAFIARGGLLCVLEIHASGIQPSSNAQRNVFENLGGNSARHI